MSKMMTTTTTTTLYLLPLLCSLLLVLAEAERTFKNGSGCNQKDFEATFNRVARVGDKKEKFPETNEQLEVYCDNNFKDLKRLEGFKKRNCFEGDSLRTFVSLLTYSIKSHMKHLCARKGANRKATELITAASCLNKHQARLDRCMTRVNNHLEVINTVPTSTRLRTPYLCCQYVQLHECMMGAFANDTACTAKASAAIETATSSVMGNLQGNYCGEYTADTDKCSTLPALKPPKVSKTSFIINVANLFDVV